MNNSGLPQKITIPFARDDSSKATIPTNATSGTTGTLATGAAAMDSGFPPLTKVPRSAGGIAPHGEDFNGILYSITSKLQALDAGAIYPFDSAFATAISGYPNGAVVMSSDLSGTWLNTTDGNSTNPEGTAAASTGWIPFDFNGASAVSISTANVTLNCLTAAKPILILSGALTANRYLYVPAWAKDWTIINNCTGAFSVIVSTIGGLSTTSIKAGNTAKIYCDGSNVYEIKVNQSSTSQSGIVQLVNDLTTGGTDKALTAEQGVVLKNSIPASIVQYFCRVTGGSTPVFSKNSGFLSVTRISQGVFEFTFLTEMPDTNYLITPSGTYGGGGGGASINIDNSFAQTTTKFRLRCTWGGDNTSGSFDPLIINVLISY